MLLVCSSGVALVSFSVRSLALAATLKSCQGVAGVTSSARALSAVRAYSHLGKYRGRTGSGGFASLHKKQVLLVPRERDACIAKVHAAYRRVTQSRRKDNAFVSMLFIPSIGPDVTEPLSSGI